MLRFVNDLQFNHAIELEKAKERAASRYGCSVRTIERYWASRTQILANGPDFQFSDLIEGIKTAIENDL